VADGPLEGGYDQEAGSHSEHPVTPKVGVSYQYDENSLFYLSAAKGYRAGGAQNPQSPVACAADLASLGISSTPSSYDSDYTWSYEAGTKSALFGGHVIVNADVFLIKWHKIQQEIYLPTCGGLFIANEGTATARGGELEARVKPFDHLTLSLALGHTDAKFTQTVLEGQGAVLVADGEHLGGPPLTVTLSGEYDVPMASHDLYARFDYTHTNAAPADDPRTFGYDPQLTPDPHTDYLTLRTGIRIAKLNISLFGSNVTDQHPNLSRYHLFYGSPLLTDVTFRPRTLGITAEYRF
jgi:outer membrane receptor protein involved in Fe transport